MNDVMISGVLEGVCGQMAFTCSLPLLTSRQYAQASQLVQWSIQHGHFHGPGLPVLNAALFDLMTSTPISVVDNLQVPDTEVATVLTAVGNMQLFVYGNRIPLT